MSLLLFSMIVMADLHQIDRGLASVYDDAILACPKSSYQKTKLPTCAHRDLPCGAVVFIKRVDGNKIIKAVVADRGPFGVCKPSNKNTRACGTGSKWVNGRNYFKKKIPMESATWRGVLDMSIPLAKSLGIKNRLIPVIIYSDLANSKISNDHKDIQDDPKIVRISNDINILTSFRSSYSDGKIRDSSSKVRD